ncbi:long-chain-fatty-acid--CoA ligase [Syntrophobacter fumaroxidans]|uniref:AMP-dependent synthetase and ligase n=1 Tax=Syntrophobacter fumaroxidans (strain DSM 10017 / MPOB) TaxID=335543 RepID=A0LEF9_SYNFM|nr:long-chain fatty acid--CoA ligase [Syntrophobacter fumaroxidans]ABK15811.1 AMP-dependent synthetase and ligase [Syntrophobacter fumaroxidans MPOB]
MDRIWLKSYDPRVPHHAEYPEECLPRLLEARVKKLPGNSATEFYGARLTYEALWKQISSLANALRLLGLRHGDRVAVMLPNCPQTVITYYAVLWLGGVVVLTNPLYVEREMEHQWKDSGAKYLVVLDHLYPKARKVIPETAIEKVIVTGIAECLPFLLKHLYPLKAKLKKLFTAVPYDERTIFNFTRLIRSTEPTPPPCEVRLDDLALLQYTGGTTGIAKGVMLSHRNILSNVIQLASWVQDLRFGEERFLALLPIFHVFGMTVAMNLPLYAGSALVLVPRFDIDEIMKTIRKARPTLFPGVPTIYAAINGHPKAETFDLSSIRICVTGSAPMPVESLRRFESLTGSVILEGYGLSETSPVTHANPVEGVRKPGSIGLALPDTDCKIVDLELGTRDMAVGEVGELVIRGPQVMKAYWKMPEETANALRDGWLYTGDIARMDEDGYVYIIDRKKDMIISGGYNIYPREVDEVLYEHPKVLDAVAVGVPDDYRGEIVKAFIVPRVGETLTEDEIKQFCKTRLAAYKVPRLIELRDSLPKTAVGKISRKELRKQALDEHESKKTREKADDGR